MKKSTTILTHLPCRKQYTLTVEPAAELIASNWDAAQMLSCKWHGDHCGLSQKWEHVQFYFWPFATYKAIIYIFGNELNRLIFNDMCRIMLNVMMIRQNQEDNAIWTIRAAKNQNREQIVCNLFFFLKFITKPLSKHSSLKLRWNASSQSIEWRDLSNFYFALLL